MNRKFIINLAFLLFLNFLVKPFYILGIDAEVQNRVGVEQYGMYFSLLGFTFLFSIILDFGIVNYNTRTLSREPHLLQKYFSNIVSLRLILAGIYTIFILILGFLIGYNSIEIKMLIWLVVNQIIASFTLYFRSNLTGLLLFKYDSIVSVLDRFLLIIVCSILLWGNLFEGEFNIYWFIWAQTFAYAITAITAFIFLAIKQNLGKLKLDKIFSIAILKQSFPYALLILLMTFYYRVDSVMLERMLEDGKTQTGIYANAFRFFEAANNIAFLFAMLLLPIFSNLIKHKKSVDKLVNLSSRILIPGAILIAITCYFFRAELIGARYSENITEASEVFGILMLCFVFISTTYIFGTLLTANGNLKMLNKIAFTGVILNVILNLILIPTYKAYGAALASLITQALTAIAQIYLSKTYFKFKVNYSLLTRIFVFTMLIIGVSYYFTEILEIELKFFYLILLELIVGFVLLLGLRIFQLKGLKALLISTDLEK
jgi:O-antigen/teichoic acid export membrane protein